MTETLSKELCSDQNEPRDEDAEIITLLENEFEARYTVDDDEYAETLYAADPPPPCVQNWYSRPKRTYDWTRGDGSNRGGPHRNQRGGYDRRQQHPHDNRYRHHDDHRRHHNDSQANWSSHDRSSYQQRGNYHPTHAQHHRYDKAPHQQTRGRGRPLYAGMRAGDIKGHPYSRNDQSNYHQQR